MLVLSRARGESLKVILEDGRLLTVCVVGLDGQRARIGIEAPKEIAVHRSEVYDEVLAAGGQMRSTEERLKRRAALLRSQADELEAQIANHQPLAAPEPLPEAAAPPVPAPLTLSQRINRRAAGGGA
jgi:carbon storage regulator